MLILNFAPMGGPSTGLPVAALSIRVRMDNTPLLTGKRRGSARPRFATGPPAWGRLWQTTQEKLQKGLNT